MTFKSAFAAVLVAATLPLSAVAASNPPAANIPSQQAVRVSTGVTEPVLVKSVPVLISDDHASQQLTASTRFLVKLTVGEDGKVRNINVLQSGSPFYNADVIKALSQFEFKPATLDNQPVAVNMNLHLNVEHK
jgi:TonB family protein